METMEIYQHLCNNSISKYYVGEQEDDITKAGNMWDLNTFKQWLRYGLPSKTCLQVFQTNRRLILRLFAVV